MRRAGFANFDSTQLPTDHHCRSIIGISFWDEDHSGQRPFGSGQRPPSSERRALRLDRRPLGGAHRKASSLRPPPSSPTSECFEHSDRSPGYQSASSTPTRLSDRALRESSAHDLDTCRQARHSQQAVGWRRGLRACSIPTTRCASPGGFEPPELDSHSRRLSASARSAQGRDLDYCLTGFRARASVR